MITVIILIYIAMAAITIGFVWSGATNKKTFRNAIASLLIGVLWPLSILFGFGCYMAERPEENIDKDKLP